MPHGEELDKLWNYQFPNPLTEYPDMVHLPFMQHFETKIELMNHCVQDPIKVTRMKFNPYSYIAFLNKEMCYIKVQFQKPRSLIQVVNELV